MKDCRFDFHVDPRCLEMDADTFRGFVDKECVPAFYEAIAKVRSRTAQLVEVLDEDMRGGEASVSCSADSKGNVSCSGSVSVRW